MTNKFSFTGKVQIALPRGAASVTMLNHENMVSNKAGDFLLKHPTRTIYHVFY